jgi:isoleucyl-tRNA synthetase
MDDVLKVVVIGRACRNAANIKNRQPIGQCFIKASFTLDDYYLDIVKDELNVKTVEFKDDVREYSSYTFKPQLKTVGPKYGKLLGKIREALATLDGNDAMDKLNAEGALTFDFDGEKVELTKDDLLIEIAKKEGFVSDSNYGITVVMDTNLTEELITEGFIREIISKVQTMRKEAGFEVMDYITIYVKDNQNVEKLVSDNKDAIMKDVLAKDIVTDAMDGYTKEWNINNEVVTLGVKKI